jgi:LuxR family maltose regulon positive regulatory protein
VAVVPSALLHALDGAALVVVQAPAGFGKTTTVRAALAEAPGVAWYDAQPWDADAFLGPLVERVRLVRPDAGRTALALAESGAPPERYATALAHELRYVEEPLRIVVDDAHLLGPSFSGFARALARAAPPFVRLVVLARTPLDVALPEAVAAGRGALIDMQTLRFDAAAIGAAAGELGVAVDTRRAATILARTEGWPLGAVLALRAGSDALLEELVEREIAALDAPTRAGLERVVVFEIVDAQVAGDDPAALEALRRLATASPFVARASEGFRLQPLFRDALLRRLAPDEVARRHRAAAAAYTADGRLRAALFHLERSASADADLAFLRDAARAALAIGLTEQVQATLRRLRTANVDEPALYAFVDGLLAKARGDDPRPRFAAARAEADARADPSLGFWTRLEEVEADLARGERIDVARIDELLARAAADGPSARAAAAARAGWADAVAGRFEAALRRLDDVSSGVDDLAPLEAYAQTALGRFEASERIVSAFVERGMQGHELGRVPGILVWAARFALLRGDTVAAYEFATEAERVARPFLVPANEAALSMALAEAALHVGDVERARHAADAVARSANHAWYARDAARAGALARRTLARAWALEGDLAKAAASLDRADPFAAPDAAVFAAVAGDGKAASVQRGRDALVAFTPDDAADAVTAWALAELLDFVTGGGVTTTRALVPGPFAGLLARRFGDVPFARRVRAAGSAPAFELALARRLGAPQPRRATVDAPAPLEALTAREHEILELLALGLTNVEIAQRFTISTRTVETHVARITGKFGVSSRARAVARAVALGMVTVQ